MPKKKFRSAKAKEKIDGLCRNISIAEVSKSSVQDALKNSAVWDFEDGLEYDAAVESKCACIVTDGVDDFILRKLMF